MWLALNPSVRAVRRITLLNKDINKDINEGTRNYAPFGTATGGKERTS
ncbi:hypothetical protein [Arthrobacter sp. UYEF21]